MSTLVTIALVTIGLWVGSWIVMIALAKRLPPGLPRDAATFPRDVLFAAWPAEPRLLARLLGRT